MKDRLIALTEKYAASVEKVETLKDQEMLDLCARHLVEMAGHLIMSYLLLHDANTDIDLFRNTTNVYVRYAESEINRHYDFVQTLKAEDLAYYRQ